MASTIASATALGWSRVATLPKSHGNGGTVGEQPPSNPCSQKQCKTRASAWYRPAMWKPRPAGRGR